MEVSSWTVWTEALESGKNLPMDIPDIPGFKNDMAFWIILTDLLHINSIAGSKDVVFRIQACCKSLWEHQEKHHYCPNGCPKNYPYYGGHCNSNRENVFFFCCELWMEWGSPISNKSSSAFPAAWPRVAVSSATASSIRRHRMHLIVLGCSAMIAMCQTPGISHHRRDAEMSSILQPSIVVHCGPDIVKMESPECASLGADLFSPSSPSHFKTVGAECGTPVRMEQLKLP